MVPSIIRNAVRLTDYDALTNLVSTLPEGDVRTCLESGERFAGEAWNAATHNEYWVVSNGSDAVCFTVSGLTQDQANSARVLWDALRGKYPGLELDTEALVYIVREITGGAVCAQPDDQPAFFAGIASDGCYQGRLASLWK
jgi:hypothetical protein